jgi:AcrR family transcriptional regulator
MSATRQRILDTARHLFNTQGLHRVGVRDLARAAGMSAGNLAYHFRTKDDLVAALVMELHELNQRTIFSGLPSDFSLLTLYRAAVAAMRNMLEYRFVLLSYVDAVTASPRLQELDSALLRKRQLRHEVMLEALIEGRYLDPRVRARSEVLYEQSSMISSGWLAAAALRGRSDDTAVLYFAKLGCALLEPHCTLRGRRQMKQIQSGAHDRG